MVAHRTAFAGELGVAPVVRRLGLTARWRHPQGLIMLARTLSSLPDHSVAELALGEQADRRASELTKGADQDVQGTLASIETLRRQSR